MSESLSLLINIKDITYLSLHRINLKVHMSASHKTKMLKKKLVLNLNEDFLKCLLAQNLKRYLKMYFCDLVRNLKLLMVLNFSREFQPK